MTVTQNLKVTGKQYLFRFLSNQEIASHAFGDKGLMIERVEINGKISQILYEDFLTYQLLSQCAKTIEILEGLPVVRAEQAGKDLVDTLVLELCYIGSVLIAVAFRER